MHQDGNNTESIESDHDIHAVPDVELLTFQKQRSTPAVQLSEVGADEEEIIHCEVENFAQGGAISAAQMGMAPAGTDEHVIRTLHKQGSIDASPLHPDVVAAIVVDQEEAKEEAKQE